MNIKAIILCGALAAAGYLPAAENLTGQFQKALFEEEGNRNLPAAIEGYEAVVKQLDEQRPLAATAVFRLGECYRKLGRTNDAVRAYERILSEFKDQETLVKLSRQNLSILQPIPETAGDEYVIKPGDSLTKIATANGTSTRRLLELNPGLDPRKLLVGDSIRIKSSTDYLRELMARQTRLRARELELLSQYTTEHPFVVQVRKDLANLDELVAKTRTELGDEVPDSLVASQQGGIDRSTLKQEGDRLRAEIQHLESANSDDERMALIQLLMPDPQLSKLGDMVIDARTKMAGLTPDLGLQNPIRIKAQSELDALQEQVDSRIAAVLKAAKAKLEVLNQVIAQSTLTSSEAPAQGAAGSKTTAMTTEEAEELRRVQALVANSPDLINRSYKEGKVPLVYAIEKGYLNVVKFLLAHGANAKGQRELSLTPLHKAAQLGHLAIVEQLLRAGAEVNVLDDSGRTPLLIACNSRFVSVARALLDAGANPNAGTVSNSIDGKSCPLGVAGTASAKLLLERGAQVDGPPGCDPPIVRAGAWPAKLNLLLEYHAKPSLTNSIGETALFHAVRVADLTNVVELLELGLDPNKRNAKGTPVIQDSFFATVNSGYSTEIRDRNWAVVKELINGGADPNTKLAQEYIGQPDPKQTLLHVAAFKGDVRAIQFLLDKGADVNAKAADGHTPLHLAAVGNHVEAIKLLLKHHADVNAVDQYGDSPLHFAAMAKSLEAARALIEGGADREAKDKNGDAPIWFGKGDYSISSLGVPKVSESNRRLPFDGPSAKAKSGDRRPGDYLPSQIEQLQDLLAEPTPVNSDSENPSGTKAKAQ